MLIAGFSKLSMLDYPGKLSAVIFAPYCNMRCWYCHNAQILSGDVPLLPEDYVMDYLEKRKNMLEGVVITGGEPTLRPDLLRFMEGIKALGYLVKLDTNGTSPKVVKSAIERKLVNYIAMDIHAPESKMREISRTAVNMDDIKESVWLTMSSGVDYEFRTTFAPTLDSDDLLEIAEIIKGTKAFYLQQYRPVIPKEGERPVVAMPPAHSPEYVRQTAELVKEKLGTCEMRGL